MTKPFAIKFNHFLTKMPGLSNDDRDTVIWMGVAEDKFEYFKPGWPFLITGDESWYFIKDSRRLNGHNHKSVIFFIELPKTCNILESTEMIPLNQFDKKIENEEILNYATCI